MIRSTRGSSQGFCAAGLAIFQSSDKAIMRIDPRKLFFLRFGRDGIYPNTTRYSQKCLGLSPVVSAQMIVVGGTKIGDYKCFLICEAANKLKPVSSLGVSFYGGLKHPCNYNSRDTVPL